TAARTIRIRNVHITSDTDTNEFGVYIQQANKTVYIEECWIQGGDFSIAIIEDIDVFMFHNHVEVNARPLSGGAAIFTNDADAVIRMHGDTVDGVIYRNAGVITYKNNSGQYEVWQGAYDSVAATTIHNGMSIQDAITAAAAETPAPGTAIQVPGPIVYGYITYTVLIHPGLYDESVALAHYVNLKGVGPPGSVVVHQRNATVVGIDGNYTTEVQNITFRLTADDGGLDRIFWDRGNDATIKLRDIVFEAAVSGGSIINSYVTEWCN
ncbi:unnamed protein product, partial [marine sediment metagenome]